MYWWSQRSNENIFIEITRRTDLGSDLRAPITARGGMNTGSYALVGAVHKGDVVVHYDSAAEQIVGVSRATGERFNEPIWWVARGTSARRAGAKPGWLPGLVIALESYRPLATPLSLSALRHRHPALFAVRDALQSEHPRQSLYFPWIPYQDSLRTFQAYLAKFPRAALDVLPEVREAVDALEEQSAPRLAQPNFEEVARDIASNGRSLSACDLVSPGQAA